jgi:GntR family transcriptional repressor for pyruvate dehydrogenase complex
MTIAATDPHTSAGHPVIAGILGYLQERRLQPGDRLPSERDFSERLGVGRNALREAIATLVTLRVVESRPNSGIYLRHLAKDSSFETLVMLASMGATPSGSEVAETMEVRSHLELLAVDLACKRHTEQDLHRLDGILARTDRLLAEEGNIAALDTEFHVNLVEATHNSILVRVLNAFYQFTAGRREVLFSDLAQGKASGRDHRKLVEHIRQRDSTKAQQLILRHMGRARDYWSTLLAPSDS